MRISYKLNLLTKIGMHLDCTNIDRKKSRADLAFRIINGKLAGYEASILLQTGKIVLIKFTSRVCPDTKYSIHPIKFPSIVENKLMSLTVISSIIIIWMLLTLMGVPPLKLYLWTKFVSRNAKKI